MASISPERSPTDPDTEEKKLGTPGQGGIMEPDDLRNADGSSVNGSDVLALQDVDPALNMKMHLVNNVSRHLRRASHWREVLRPGEPRSTLSRSSPFPPCLDLEMLMY